MGITLPCCEFRPDGEMLTERHLQALWYDREMRPAVMFSREGEEVRVVDPGEWNLENGPDFKNATIEVGAERRRVRGDIEIHLRPSDWTAHGHARDADYSNVIAHITWSGGAPPPTLPPSVISIPIGRLMAAEVGFSPEQIDLSGYPFGRLPADPPPCRGRIGGNPDFAHAVLANAGALRLKAKARRLFALLAARPHERLQIFYEEIMNALGYRRNSQGFRFVAKIVPYSAVVAEPDNVDTAFRSAAAFVEWDRRGVRPGNSPEHRLESAARFFSGDGISHFANAHDFSRKECRRMVAELMSASHLGRGRASAMLANVIVPMAIAEGRLAEPPSWLPPEDVSSPMRLTAFRMFGRDHNPAVFYAANGLYMQGLLQIHREYCLEMYPDCAACPVGVVGGI